MKRLISSISQASTSSLKTGYKVYFNLKFGFARNFKPTFVDPETLNQSQPSKETIQKENISKPAEPHAPRTEKPLKDFPPRDQAKSPQAESNRRNFDNDRPPRDFENKGPRDNFKGKSQNFETNFEERSFKGEGGKPFDKSREFGGKSERFNNFNQSSDFIKNERGGDRENSYGGYRNQDRYNNTFEKRGNDRGGFNKNFNGQKEFNNKPYKNDRFSNEDNRERRSDKWEGNDFKRSYSNENENKFSRGGPREEGQRNERGSSYDRKSNRYGNFEESFNKKEDFNKYDSKPQYQNNFQREMRNDRKPRDENRKFGNDIGNAFESKRSTERRDHPKKEINEIPLKEDDAANTYQKYAKEVGNKGPTEKKPHKKEGKVNDKPAKGGSEETRFKFQSNEEEHSQANLNKFDHIFGAHTIRAALSHSLRKNHELYILNSYKDSLPESLTGLIELAKKSNCTIHFLPKDKLERMTGGKPHNGVVMKCDKRSYVKLDNFESFEKEIGDKKGIVTLILNQLADPQNFGSVLRTAFFLGVDYILVNSIKKPIISPTISKISSGSVECINLYEVPHLKSFVNEAVNKGWKVITSQIETHKDIIMRFETKDQHQEETNKETLNEDSASNLETQSVDISAIALKPNENVIIIFNSIESTSQADIKAHYTTYIRPSEMSGMRNSEEDKSLLVDSLNTGVAAGVIINEVVAQVKSDK